MGARRCSANREGKRRGSALVRHRPRVTEKPFSSVLTSRHCALAPCGSSQDLPSTTRTPPTLLPFNRRDAARRSRNQTPEPPNSTQRTPRFSQRSQRKLFSAFLCANLCTAVRTLPSVPRGFFNAENAEVFAEERRGKWLCGLCENLCALCVEFGAGDLVAASPRCVLCVEKSSQAATMLGHSTASNAARRSRNRSGTARPACPGEGEKRGKGAEGTPISGVGSSSQAANNRDYCRRRAEV